LEARGPVQQGKSLIERCVGVVEVVVGGQEVNGAGEQGTRA